MNDFLEATIKFKSMTVDVFIDSASEFKEFYTGEMNEPGESVKIAVFAGCTGVLLICIICLLWYRARYKDSYSIKNPMIISINIGVYTENTTNPGIGGYCPDLDGIDNDYKHMKTLCDKLNYELYPAQEKYHWTQDEIIAFLTKSAAKLEQNISINNELNQNNYDALLAVISCHGLNNSIITSDYQLITKQSIHSIFSWKHPRARSIPRVFVFDCCDGDQDRDTDVARSISDEDEESTDEKSADDTMGKNFDNTDIQLNRQGTLVWKRDQDNPDYRLCLVHAANPGFQAKMSSEKGSYLITLMTDKLINNGNNKNNFLEK